MDVRQNFCERVASPVSFLQNPRTGADTFPQPSEWVPGAEILTPDLPVWVPRPLLILPECNTVEEYRLSGDIVPSTCNSDIPYGHYQPA